MFTSSKCLRQFASFLITKTVKFFMQFLFQQRHCDVDLLLNFLEIMFELFSFATWRHFILQLLEIKLTEQIIPEVCHIVIGRFKNVSLPFWETPYIHFSGVLIGFTVAVVDRKRRISFRRWWRQFVRWSTNIVSPRVIMDRHETRSDRIRLPDDSVERRHCESG